MDDEDEPVEMNVMRGDELLEQLQEEPTNLAPLGHLSRQDMNERVDSELVDEFRDRVENDREELLKDLLLYNDGTMVSMDEFAERLHARTGIVVADSDNHGLTYQYPPNAEPEDYGLHRDGLLTNCTERIILDINPNDTPEPLTRPADEFDGLPF